jgi:hypothetical protein
MERAAASRMRIQQAREDGERGEGGGDRAARLRAALAATPAAGGPLRVAVLSRLGGESAGVLDAFETQEERDAARDYAERVLVPSAVAALAKTLRVRLPADAPAAVAAAAASTPSSSSWPPQALAAASSSCGAARGAGAELAARDDLRRGEADLALFVTAAAGERGELCPPGAVAWAVACARDAALTGRPVVAAVNLCPRVLEQGPGSMPVERAVAAVVHELVHVMVRAGGGDRGGGAGG